MSKKKSVLKGFPPYLEILNEFNKEGPSLLSLHMKPYCNFQCKKCFVGQQCKLTTDHEFLSLDEITSLILSARDVGVKVLAISGAGEPFADPCIYDVIKLANNCGLITIIATNASLLTEEKIVFLRDNNVTFTISLDTTNPAHFAQLTNTSPAMFDKVMKNLLLAQDVYSGTHTTLHLDNDFVDVYRLAVHMTLQNDEYDQPSAVKKILTSDTLLSLSSMANDVGFAKNLHLDSDVPSSLKSEINEKHIVVCKDPVTHNNICGNFRFGLDISFDGQLLLDSHALDTRTFFKNIRDFNYNVGDAYSYMFNEKSKFMLDFLDGFCPIRSRRYPCWLELMGTQSNF